MPVWTVAAAAIGGAAVSSVLSCIPGLHVYNLMALLAAAQTLGAAWPGPYVVVPFATGLIVGYAMLNTVPSVLLAAPDESALFTVLPGQKYLLAGRGVEAVRLVAAGGLGGLFVLTLVVGPLAPRAVRLARTVLAPHGHWIIWCVIGFMLMSEWPKGGRLGQGGRAKFLDAWRSTGTGLAVFALSGLLGFLLFYRSPLAARAAYQNLMPAFVGLFTIPWLLFNLASGVQAPPQGDGAGLSGRPGAALIKGLAAGVLGGGFAAFFPAITGGTGGFLAGHAAGVRDDRAFLVSQGASKLVYYAGGFLLLFVPGVHLTRGGGAWLLRTVYLPRTYRDYDVALASLALAGLASFLLIGPLSRVVIRLMDRWGYRRISGVALGAVLTLVAGITGWQGLAVLLVAAGIGLLPVLCGSRRMNCLGVVLLPVACNLSGCGPAVARFLGLVG